MSGLQAQSEDTINGLDVREQGSALRVASSTPHLVSLGTNRLSTAVTLHPIKQGRVTIGSDPTCDVYIGGAGVCSVHCRVENSHGAVTLYPIAGRTLLDNATVVTPQRMSQGSIITLGQSNYLRFNHPEEAKLMKSVLPTGNPHKQNQKHTGYTNHSEQRFQSNIQEIYKENSLNQLDQELDLTLKEMSRKKPPVAPRKPYRDFESDSDHETKPKVNSIMAKVSKFEYYAKQQKIGNSQFYTNENDISPKVFSSNSLTVNTPAKDVLGGRTVPNYIAKGKCDQKVILLNENNAVDLKSCSYQNVAIKNKNKIDVIVRNFDETSRNDFKLPKKINNDQARDVYGKINSDKNNLEHHIHARNHNVEYKLKVDDVKSNVVDQVDVKNDIYGRIGDRNVNVKPPSVTFDRSPQYMSSGYSSGSCQSDRNVDAEAMRMKAYQDRIKEEEQKEAETARLEEILNMCAEYEKQISSGLPITPTEKRPHNKIITNGSLPRSVALTNPNFVQTSDGYYKFETSQSRNYAMSQSLPAQRNVSNYENFDFSQSSLETTPEVSTHQSIEHVGRIDEIGIPVFDERNELSSPIMLRKLTQDKPISPIGSPYENLYYNRNIKPKSPTTQSPRTRIKTTFAHKNLPSPQYFIFPTPPPVDKKPNFSSPIRTDAQIPDFAQSPIELNSSQFKNHNVNENSKETPTFGGIEKQLSLEEEIPMIDDADLSNDIECRRAVTNIHDPAKVETQSPKLCNHVETVNEENAKDSLEVVKEDRLTKNQSFDDVKKELMADIPELEEFEQDLKESKREKILKTITDDIKRMDVERDSLDSAVIEDNGDEIKSRYDSLKESRKKLLSEIHEIKCKMSEIRSQEDDILRELEMEKALIKGEYDSEIAILNIEQKKRIELIDKAKKIEEEIRRLKEKQESQQNEMRDRVEIATLKVERIEQDINDHSATEEELQNAQDILDNESKTYEDLEFQHLEEESELLANKEDLQNDITRLTKKIDAQKTRILTLKSEANENLTSALDETKVLQAEYVRLLNKVEGLTTQVQNVEKELKPIVVKLNTIERTQSPDSAFYTDQTRAKSGEFGYSPQSSDSDDLDLSKMANFEDHSKQIKDKFNSIDQMSQSMIVDIERRVADDDKFSDSPTKTSPTKEKKGFWERNFDSLKRKSKDKKPKSPEKVDIMSQSLNENMFYNNDNIENDATFDKFNSLRHSKNNKKTKDNSGPVKSYSSSKIPTFAALGKIIKKDSFGKRSREQNSTKNDSESETSNVVNRYIKNGKPSAGDNKYVKAKSLSPDKPEDRQVIKEETKEELKNEYTNKSLHTDDQPKLEENSKIHRKSYGDEPGLRHSLSEFKKIADSGKIPSQDDIDRISKVTIDAPILSSDNDVNTLGKKTFDSLMEIERKRFEMLEEQGCQMIEDEREKISELKRRAQDETKKLWDQKYKEQTKSMDSDQYVGHFERGGDSYVDDSYFNNSSMFDESSGFMSSSIEELQVRNSRTESTEDEKRSDDSRPLSHASDFSRDNILSISGAPRRSRRGIAPYSESQRPLTRYLPVERDDFDLRRHVESAGHQIEMCPYLTVSSTSCRGYLHKLGAKFHTWSKRWFVFDRESKTFVYYWDKSEKKPRGGAYFQVIEEVYLDHGNTSKSPNPQTTFVVKTRQRRYYLMAPSGESARIWIDVIFTGAQGYIDFMD